MPTRRRIDPTLGDVIAQALRDSLNVELTREDGSLMVVIDDVEITTIAWESFEYPVPDLRLDGEAAALADRMAAERRRRRFRRRMQQLRTDDHLAAEGGDLPLGRADP
jgi:regulator of protease activity HflC (stomatin/prohibitin superfamily)